MTEVRKYFGPPGCGKTTRLISIVGDEISRGLSPAEIVYVSFTKVAAKVAADRARDKFPGYMETDFRNFATIHSICFSLLGLHRSEVFSDKHLQEFGKVYRYEFSTREATNDPFQQAIQDMAIATWADFFEAMYNYWQSSGMDMDKAIDVYIKNGASFAFERKEFSTYVARRTQYKEQHGLYDFADMLIEVLKAELYPRSMRVLIADECQDNSTLLNSVVKAWAQKADRVYLAGDPYQAIFGFAGAVPLLFMNFPADQTMTLKQSYRCPRLVHALSRRIVSKFRTRYEDDDYLPRDAEGSIAKKIEFGLNDESTFWLFRTRYLLDQTYNDLCVNGVPFISRRGKRTIFDYKRDKKRRVALNLLKLRSAPITIFDLANIIDYVPSRHKEMVFLERGMKTYIREEARNNPDFKVFWRNMPDLGFTPDFLDRTNLLDILKEKEFSVHEKSYITRMVKKHGLSVLESRPKLELGTFHSVKGDEAARVIIDPTYTTKPYNNFRDGNEEEHRLIYTAITRSSRDLIVLYPSGPKYYPVL